MPTQPLFFSVFSNEAPVGNSDLCLNGKGLTADDLFSLTGNRILKTRSSLFYSEIMIADMTVRIKYECPSILFFLPFLTILSSHRHEQFIVYGSFYSFRSEKSSFFQHPTGIAPFLRSVPACFSSHCLIFSPLTGLLQLCKTVCPNSFSSLCLPNILQDAIFQLLHIF